MMTSALKLSLWVSFWAMLWVGLLGLGLGWLLARFRFWGRTALWLLCMLPLVFPPTVLGYYLIFFLKPQSPLAQLLGFSPMFHWTGASLAAGLVAFPLMLQSCKTAFEGVDQELEEAAASLGSSPLEVFKKITLPLAWPGIAAGFLLASLRALGEFGATLMVAGNIQGRTQTLPLAIYELMLMGDRMGAQALVLLLSALCIVLSTVALLWQSRGNRYKS